MRNRMAHRCLRHQRGYHFHASLVAGLVAGLVAVVDDVEVQAVEVFLEAHRD